MRIILYSLFILFCSSSATSQNIRGKWYGKLTQQPGAYKELYNLELLIKQNNNFISGESYATEKNILKVKIGFTGSLDNDRIYLKEDSNDVMQEIVPFPWEICIKNYTLAYRKVNNTEYLEGNWDGAGRDKNPCIPGQIILARTVEELEKYLLANQDSVITPAQNNATTAPPAIDFSSNFLNTAPRVVKEIVVHNANLQLQLNDYSKVDNDTVSIYLNRNSIAKNIGISKRTAVVNFKLDTHISLHELLLYAENLGQIPPNTSSLLLVDGKRTHRILIESDKQKTAAIYLRYKPKK
ncbi:MAG TPA: hypothetical protein VNI52_10140 [Sphingobacteriaceae bacterium]|nr:hypothetical protein [Sphingobacteriaceae bacterium]